MPISIADAIRTSRSSTRVAALAAALFVACCFARSDARVETDAPEVGLARTSYLPSGTYD